MSAPIKRILVPLEPSESCRSATETACRIALAHGAEVAGCALTESASVGATAIAVDRLSYLFNAASEIDSAPCRNRYVDESKLHFTRTCEEFGVPFFEPESSGATWERMIDNIRLFDLVVADFRAVAPRYDESGGSQRIWEWISRATSPILVVPADGMTRFRRVLIALDGSRSSFRAIREFVSFAHPFRCEIFLAAVDGVPDKGKLLAEANDYLALQGFNRIEIRELDSFGNSIRGRSMEGHFDMVVAGVDSPSMCFDSYPFTFVQRMIEQASKPLFLFQ